MSVNIVDKRKINRDRSTENRQRFLRRMRKTIKEQLPGIIQGRAIKDIANTGGSVKINRKTIREPSIHHDQGGIRDIVSHGNKKYVIGDEIEKDPDGQGGMRGRQAGTGQSEDDFVVDISREEFLDFFFEDLELPDLIRTELTKLKEIKIEKAGFQPDGSPNNLSLIRSYKQSLIRRISLRNAIDEEIAELEERLKGNPLDGVANARLKELIKRKESLPLFEDMDLRYHASIKREIPIAHATMIMIMDNSGSMGLKEKTIARKFFWLLYSFLKREYDEVDMVFISHTDEAKEMEEEEFFDSRDSGGTIVSTALEMASDIIKKRLLNKTNIYVAQVSDGDNMETDNGTCYEILEDDILPFVRYFAYVQVDNYHDDPADGATIGTILNNDRGLWRTYHGISSTNNKLQTKRVFQERDIFPVFVELFSRKAKQNK